AGTRSLLSHTPPPSAPRWSSTLSGHPPHLPSFPTRRSSDLAARAALGAGAPSRHHRRPPADRVWEAVRRFHRAKRRHHRGESGRSEEHTSELQSPDHLVCRLLLENKKKITEHPVTSTKT